MTAPWLQRRRLPLWTLPFQQVGQLAWLALHLVQAHTVQDLAFHLHCKSHARIILHVTPTWPGCCVTRADLSLHVGGRGQALGAAIKACGLAHCREGPPTAAS